MQLIYKGPGTNGRQGALPLPAGWPGGDHDEPDSDLAKAKIASGMYEAKRAPRSAASEPEEGEEN